MKSTINYATMFAMAFLGQCVAQRQETPGVWLYKGNDGAEPYSLQMDLDDTCHSKLADHLGVWIDKDTRSEEHGVGCGYAFQADDCRGTDNPFELDFSGSEHTIIPFEDVKIGYIGKSFQFSSKTCTGGGDVLREATSIVVPTQ